MYTKYNTHHENKQTQKHREKNEDDKDEESSSDESEHENNSNTQSFPLDYGGLNLPSIGFAEPAPISSQTHNTNNNNNDLSQKMPDNLHILTSITEYTGEHRKNLK